MAAAETRRGLRGNVSVQDRETGFLVFEQKGLGVGDAT